MKAAVYSWGTSFCAAWEQLESESYAPNAPTFYMDRTRYWRDQLDAAHSAATVPAEAVQAAAPPGSLDSEL